MNKYKRTFVASSEIFSGYKVDIDIRRIETLEDIVEIFIRDLKSVLKKYNLEALLDKLNYGNEWHIHTHTLEEILTSNVDELFYVCNHCNVNSELEVTIL